MIFIAIVLCFPIFVESQLIGARCGHPVNSGYVNCSAVIHSHDWSVEKYECQCTDKCALKVLLQCHHVRGAHVWKPSGDQCSSCNHCEKGSLPSDVTCQGQFSTYGYKGEVKQCQCKFCPQVNISVKCDEKSRTWRENSVNVCKKQCGRCPPSKVPEDVKCQNNNEYGYLHESITCQCTNNCLGIKSFLRCGTYGNWEHAMHKCGNSILLRPSNVFYEFKQGKLTARCLENYTLIHEGSVKCSEDMMKIIYEGGHPVCVKISTTPKPTSSVIIADEESPVETTTFAEESSSSSTDQIKDTTPTQEIENLKLKTTHSNANQRITIDLLICIICTVIFSTS